jgi:hypothetical protein
MMAEPLPRPEQGLLADEDEPLIALVFEENGREVVRYFTSDEEADAAVGPDSIQAALDLAGAWSDLDWDEMVEGLDRIRHESPPSPPISI